MSADRGNKEHDYVIDVPANPTINMLRTTQQHHVQLSAMADVKANIVITASSVLLTLSIQGVDNETIRVSLVVLSLFMLGALVFSVLSVLPKFRSEPLGPHRGRPTNLLFFGDFALLDEDTYLCSPRTMYRILDDNKEVRERRNQLRHPNYAKPELIATAPNEVWTWDITKLRGPAKWTYYYLYVVLDIFSRYVVGWMIAHAERAARRKPGGREVGRRRRRVHRSRGRRLV